VETEASIAFSPFIELPQLRRVYLDDYRDCQWLSATLELIRLIASREAETLAIARQLAGRLGFYRNHFGVQTTPPKPGGD